MRHGYALAMMKYLLLIFVALLTLNTRAMAQASSDDQISVSGEMVVSETGSARLTMSYKFSPPRLYDRMKKAYPNLYVLFRDFGVSRASYEVLRDSLQVTSDDAARSLTFKGTLLGVATCKRQNWAFEISKSEKIITRQENRIFTTMVAKGIGGALVTGKFEYALPASAKIIEYSPDKQQLAYSLPRKAVAGKPTVDVLVRSKKRLMGSVYKVYADPEVASGAYWVGKTIFKNTGAAPIFDLKISYRLGEYSDESLPERYAYVPGGGTIVDLYYPVISSKVAQLKSRTPSELRIKYEYKDAAGNAYSDQLAQRIEMLGVNQFEFSNLSDEDRTDSWFDSFNNAALLTAFVTKNDDAVRQFAGMVSEAAGGASAASNPREAIKWLQAAYEQQLFNNIVYQTPSGFLTAEKSLGQEIKFPRDVFRDKSGTCIDLAITYASLAEAVGLKANLMLIPGHCFTVIRFSSGETIAVENTGLAGGDERMSFEQAVQAGNKTLNEAMQNGLYYLIDIDKELGEGKIASPELPALGADFLEKAGIRRIGSQSDRKKDLLGKFGIKPKR
jgi:hypothetical protein